MSAQDITTEFWQLLSNLRPSRFAAGKLFLHALEPFDKSGYAKTEIAGRKTWFKLYLPSPHRIFCLDIQTPLIQSCVKFKKINPCC